MGGTVSFERNLAWNKIVGCSVSYDKFSYEDVDQGIAGLVRLFRDNGFWTVQSCAGTISGGLHCCKYPYVAMLPDVNRDEYHTLYRLRKFLEDNHFDFYTVKFSVTSVKNPESMVEIANNLNLDIREKRFNWSVDFVPFIEVEFSLPWEKCRRHP